MQRLETAELVRILAAEGRKLQSAAEDAEKKSERAQGLHEDLSRQEAKLASTMEGVGALFSLLNTALEDPSFAREPEAAVEAQTALETEALRDTDFSGGKKRPQRRRRLGGAGGLQSAAARVRTTPHRNRTDDEKRWVALDAVVNPQLYHHVTLAEAEEMRWDALYYTRLDREDVLRVLSLPPQVQLALPFLHTPVEVAAHELLARYSHGIDPDHFTRLDKGSQDACERATAASSTGAGSTEAALSGAGDGNQGQDGRSMKREPPTGAAAAVAANEVLGATRRVLACMRRAFEANLKIPAEQDDEEAVWCALDKKLRAELYRDSDEAAADRAEETFREADAREDARHTWLAASRDVKSGSTGRGATNSSEFARAAGSPIIGSVVQKKRVAEEVLAAKKVAEDREALVAGVVACFSEDDVKALAAAAVGGSLAGGPLEPGPVMTAAVDDGEGAHGQEKTFMSATSSGGVNVGAEAFAIAPAERTGEHNAEAASQQKYGEQDGSGGGDDGIDGDEASKEEEVERKRKLAQERRCLVKIVQKVLPLFLVSEEETPLGRDMTRSLAMMQEVVLRLGRGQRNVFSGLNPQSAMAILQSHPPLTTPASSAAQGLSAATAPVSMPPVGTRGAGEGRLLGAAAAAAAVDHERGRESTSMEKAAAALPGAWAEAPTRLWQEVKPLRSDGTMASSADSATDAKHRLADEMSSTSESRPWGDIGGSVNSGSYANVGDCSTVSEITQKLDKVFGSWEEVHPAAIGTGSQEKEFVAGEGGGEHPASFRRAGASSQGINAELLIFENADHNARDICPAIRPVVRGMMACLSRRARWSRQQRQEKVNMPNSLDFLRLTPSFFLRLPIPPETR